MDCLIHYHIYVQVPGLNVNRRVSCSKYEENDLASVVLHFVPGGVHGPGAFCTVMMLAPENCQLQI